MSEPISPNIIGNIISDVIGIQTDFQALLARLDKISQQVQIPALPTQTPTVETITVAAESEALPVATGSVATVPVVTIPVIEAVAQIAPLATAPPKPKAPISLYCDAVAFQNGRARQWAAAGVVAVNSQSRPLFQRSFPLGNYTAVAAGMIAIEKALDEAIHRYPTRNLVIYSDLQPIVKVANGEWNKCMNLDLWEKIEALLAQAREKGSQVEFVWLPKRSENPHKQLADKLARGNNSLALDE